MSIDNLVDSVSTYKRRSPLGFLYTGPFALFYAIWVYYWVYSLGFDVYYEIGCIGVVIIGILQVLTVLFCYWFVEVNCLFTCDYVSDINTATLAKVKPQPNNGWTELVPIKRTKLPDGSIRIWFLFQKITYFYNEESKLFGSITYDTDKVLQEFFDHKGHASDESIEETKHKYGDNQMEMTIPLFSELFIERATAPFFVFQVFCVGLWCLEDMWYYSLFTLVMLMTFEAMIVKQQLKNMQDIRNMGNKPYQVYAYRKQRWNRVSSNELTFGDIISVNRSADEITVPCDLLLIRGQCIVDESMLTGESVPQMKEPIEGVDRRKVFDIVNDSKLHVISGGTKIVQHNPPPKNDAGMKSPDNGCICYVLRTGFNTSQGQLLRTILFGVKRVTANNLETFAFILFLMIFAVVAAAYVWIKGTADPDRNRFKLFLECSLIITSVIPPELPIELSLAVNNSLMALQKLGVFCTEPFRIPFAGKVNICCFDKTGTLTTDNLVVEGIAGIVGESCEAGKKDKVRIAKTPQEADLKSIQVLASCQSLVRFDDELVGDPLEKACLSWIDWNLSKNDTVIPQKSKHLPLKIVQRYHFSSQMKRMTVVSSYMFQGVIEPKHLAVVKGAPETLRSMFKNPPADYDKTYQKLAQEGSRVLAMGIRELGSLSHAEVRANKREDYEHDLEFAGFVVISCPLKPDTKAMIKEIVEASHEVTMITGDNPLTACHVAKVLHFTKKTKPILILDEHEEGNGFKRQWKSVDGEIVIDELAPEGKKEVKKFLNDYEFCLTGHGYDYLSAEAPHFCDQILPHVRIFARMSPKQKEHVVIRLKYLGYVTLMCGDGTNDVGALKHSNVGVALLAHPYDPEKEKEQQIQKQKKVMEIRQAAEDVRRVNPNDLPARITGQRKVETPPQQAPKRPNNPHLAKLEQLMKELEEEERLQVIKLGDASIAAPFTSKYTSIQSICHVIKQGRCTLVTTLQMFKILALNALISAYSQSVLYLNGVKFSDSQITVQGLLLAACFFFVCRSNPLKTLSKQRPIPNIFNAYTLLTVTCQFAVHFVLLITVFERIHEIEPIPDKVNLEAEFKPNLLNSAIYILSMALQMCTFAVNYRGRPFMESLTENKALLYSVVISLGSVFVLASNSIPEFSAKFEIILMPEDFRNFMTMCVAADLVLCFIIDRTLNFFLGDMRA